MQNEGGRYDAPEKNDEDADPDKDSFHKDLSETRPVDVASGCWVEGALA